MVVGVNKSLDEQLEVLEKILMQNDRLIKVLKVLEEYSKENADFVIII